jgi:hypothetical protein
MIERMVWKIIDTMDEIHSNEKLLERKTFMVCFLKHGTFFFIRMNFETARSNFSEIQMKS